jgi:hypothetical protein
VPRTYDWTMRNWRRISRLDPLAAGAMEAPADDDHVDIGSGDEALEDLLEE